MVKSPEPAPVENNLEEQSSEKEILKTMPELENQPESKEAKVKKKFRLGKKIWFVLIPIILLLVVMGVMGFLTYRQAKKAQAQAVKIKQIGGELKTSFEAQDFGAIFAQVGEIQAPLAEIRTAYDRLGFWQAVPWLGRFYQDGDHFLVAGEEGYQAVLAAAAALEPYQDLLVESEEESDEVVTVEERLLMVLDTLDLLEPQFDEIVGHLTKAREAVEQVDASRYPADLFGYPVKEYVQEAQTLVGSTAKSVEEIRPLISYLKPLLGIPETKTYMLLFQNDAELRPSGGFLTAYSYLQVTNGKFTPLGSHDIYALDAQFGNRLEAPEPIQEYLPNVNYWHLRDMNLSPDFVVSMETFWENYQKIPGARQVDGIIAVDTQLLVDIFEVLGPIGVSGWGNFSAEIDPRCDCPQVVYELEVFADTPTSSIREDRKGIIGPLMHSILGNVMGSPRSKWPQFFNVFFENVAGKHALFYFMDPELQSALEKMNASGRVREFEGDYFQLVDCNFGGAKSNLFITRQVTHEVSEVGGGLVHSVVVDYRNPAPGSDCNLERGNLCLNSFYRNWFRVYLPLGSELIEFKGSEVEIKTYEELGKTVFDGFYGFTPGTSLKPEGKLTLEFSYRLPASITADDYRLLIQKQPGTQVFEHEVGFGNDLQTISLDADTILVF